MAIVKPAVGEAMRLEFDPRPPWSITGWLDSLRDAAAAMTSAIWCTHPREIPGRMYMAGRRPAGGGFVYVVQATPGGLVKIGKCVDPRQSLPGLQGRSPVPLTLLAIAKGYGDLECHWHRQFKMSRVHCEWFKPDIAPVFIDAMATRSPKGCARCVLVGDQR